MFFSTGVFITVLQALLFYTEQETQMTFSMYETIARQRDTDPKGWKDTQDTQRGRRKYLTISKGK